MSSQVQSSVREYSIRVPKNSKKRYHVMRFNGNLDVDIGKWTQVKMERENNMKEYKGIDEEQPKFGAGSEFGREAKEEARRKKLGIIAKKYKVDDQPWILKTCGSTVKKFKGIREGGVSENTAYYVFTHAEDGAIEAFPLQEWYKFQPIQRYKSLTAEEAEQEYSKRNKHLNFFSLMLRKRLKGDEETEMDEEEKGKKASSKSKELKISEMDEWMNSSDEESSDNEGAKEEEDDDKKDSKKKGKGKKGTNIDIPCSIIVENTGSAPAERNVICEEYAQYAEDARRFTSVESVPGPSNPTPMSSATKSTSEGKRNIGVVVKGQKTSTRILKHINITRSKHLSHREKLLYFSLKETLMSLSLKKKKLDTCKQRLAMAEELRQDRSFQGILKYVNVATYNFLMCQVRNQLRNPYGRRYTLEEKVLALALYKASPKGYRLLCRLFSLPKSKTLRILLQRLPFHPGVNDHIFQHLKKSTMKMKDQETYCVLIFDEISLESNLNYDRGNDEIVGLEDYGNEKKTSLANYANVFMIKGIYRQWKQPVAFTFSRGPIKAVKLKVLITDLIHKCQEIGLRVVSTICDQGSGNQAAINKLLEEKRQYCLQNNIVDETFGFLVGNEEIVPLYDIPHLFKGLRNNLLTKSLKFNQDGVVKIAKWNHIQQFYLLDSSDPDLRICNKLTDAHVIPEKMNKMKVKLCTQIFSHTVGSLMKRIAQWGAPKKKKRDTNKEAFEDSDDGDGEGRELDYISDSTDSEPENTNLDSVAEEKGLKKLLNSDEEDEDSDKSDKEMSNEEDDKDKEGDNQSEDKGDKDKKKNKKKPKKEMKKEGKKDESLSDFSSDSSSEDESKKKSGDKKSKKEEVNSENSSRSATPTENKRKIINEALSGPANKKMKLDLNSIPGSSESGITEEAVRKYLMRKPMTTTELLQKFKSKKTGLSSEQLVNIMTQILKRINPVKQMLKGKMYLSIKPN